MIAVSTAPLLPHKFGSRMYAGKESVAVFRTALVQNSVLHQVGDTLHWALLASPLPERVRHVLAAFKRGSTKASKGDEEDQHQQETRHTKPLRTYHLGPRDLGQGERSSSFFGKGIMLSRIFTHSSSE